MEDFDEKWRGKRCKKCGTSPADSGLTNRGVYKKHNTTERNNIESIFVECRTCEYIYKMDISNNLYP